MKEKLKKFFKNRIIQIILFFIFVICLLLYGPYGGFRDWLITTSMTTMNHKWIAKMLYPEKIIENVLEQNRVQEIDENTDTSLINGTKANSNLENEILQKNNEDDVYKIINIKESKYTGKLAVVYDASRVSTVATKDIWEKGENLVDMANRTNSVLAINGGGFSDNENTAGIPVGITFSNGNLITENNYDVSGGFIGFNTENKLILGKYSKDELLNLNIRDRSFFWPVFNCKWKGI